jgi:hypothetical protein
MEPAPAQPRALEVPDFVDGLGERTTLSDAASGDSVEMLRLRSALTSVPSFEFALRERTARLANFRHTYFARVRRVDRLSPAGLGVISDHVAGFRLSQMLRIAAERRLAVDTNAGLCLLRQLLPAIALLHENARDVAHGALAPERLIVTPHARLVVAEYVLGSALEQLQLTHDRLWVDYGIAMPPSAGAPRFDHRADVMQIGITALALIAGRPLGADDLARIPGMLAESTETSAGGARQPLSQGLRGWLARALQLDTRRPFLTVRDAHTALDQILVSDSGYVASTVAVEALISRCVDSVIAVVPDVERPEPPPAQPRVPAPQASVTTAPPAAATSPAPHPPVGTPAARTPVVPSPSVPPAPTAAEPDQGPSRYDLNLDALQSSFGPFDPEPFEQLPAVEAKAAARSRARIMYWLRIAGTLLLVAGTVAAGAWGARRYFAAAPPAAETGLVVVDSAPKGVPVFVDGLDKGVTPLRIQLKPGPHIVELRGSGVPRVLPVTVTANTTLSQFVEFASAATPATGQLDVRSDPPGARILIDGQPVGVAPMLITNLEPGPHAVVLEHDDASVQHTVTVEAGGTASLVAPVAAAGPASGWVAVTAPFAMQIFENGRLVGSTESERIMVPAGRHVFEIVNDVLSYRERRTVQVQPGRTATIGIDLPNGTLNLNAQPWAEVWIDNRRVGETPIGNLSVPIGPHEVVFRHPQFGERRQAISVTAGTPVRLSVDMRK